MLISLLILPIIGSLIIMSIKNNNAKTETLIKNIAITISLLTFFISIINSFHTLKIQTHHYLTHLQIKLNYLYIKLKFYILTLF